MTNDKIVNIGYSDEPAAADLLGVGKYYDALANYIRYCPTPTTIAIQGDWGTGKSTAMRIIREKINDDTHVIEFNTWQYSKAAGQSLIVPLLSMFIDKIEELGGELTPPECDTTDEKNTKIKISKAVKNAMLGVVNLGIDVGTYYFADRKYSLGNTIDHLLDTFKEARSSDKSKDNVNASVDNLYDYYKTIGSVQNMLKTSLEGINDNKRFVVFVDDLDRLNPEDAVSLLEDLKNIMFISDCVFVLALDQKIVNKGLSKKYGEDTEYSKHFFDKIIQLPFFLPVNQYKIDNYIEELKNENDFISKIKVEDIVGLLDACGETNPRTIKRLLNILQLYSSLNDETYEEHTIEYFSIILLQISRRDLYDDLANEVKDHDKIWSAEKCLNGEAEDDQFWEEIIKRDPILKVVSDKFCRDYKVLSDVLLATSLTGAGNYKTVQEKVEDTKQLLMDYTKVLFGVDPQNNSETYVCYEIKDGYLVEIRIPSTDKSHVNLTLKSNKTPDFDKDVCSNDYKVICDKYFLKRYVNYEDIPKDMKNVPCIFANETQSITLSRISVEHSRSLQLAGELLRSFKDQRLSIKELHV